jgi:5'-nucleotidase (lipoprotein e(P4) family)
MKKYFVLFVILTAGCGTARQPKATSSAQNITANGKLLASLFQQRAAEYRALCYQAFNIARVRLDEALLKPQSKPLAIITDIDETVLYNSPYDVKQSLVGKDYEQSSWEQ